MNAGQEVMMAALAEVGISARPGPTAGSVVHPPADRVLVWRASNIARQAIGLEPMAYEEWLSWQPQ